MIKTGLLGASGIAPAVTITPVAKCEGRRHARANMHAIDGICRAATMTPSGM